MSYALAQTGLWDDDAGHRAFLRCLGRALLLSLVAHLALVLVATWIRLPRQIERPLASIEISLASAPVKKQEQPVEAPKPTPPVQVSPPPPVSRADVKLPAKSSNAKSSNDVMREIMKGIQLPPDAPKFGDISPVEKPIKSQLKLPDVPVASEAKELAAKPSEVKARPSLTEDVSRALNEELTKLKALEVPKPVKTDAPSKSMPQLDAKAPSSKAVDAAVLMPGAQAGTSPYWSRVQSIISSNWVPPPVGQAGENLAVVVKFRLSRSGVIGFTAIEETSGNPYFDLAGQRAIMSTKTLPPFPSDMHEAYIDVPMRFRVGEGAR